MSWRLTLTWAFFGALMLALGQSLADLAGTMEQVPGPVELLLLPLFNFGLAGLPALGLLGLLGLLSAPFAWAEPAALRRLPRLLASPDSALPLLGRLLAQGLALLLFVGLAVGLQFVAARVFNHEGLRAVLLALLLAGLGLLLLGLGRLGAGRLVGLLRALLGPRSPLLLWAGLGLLALLALAAGLFLARGTLALLGWDKVLWVLLALPGLGAALTLALWRPLPPGPLLALLLLSPALALLPGFHRDFMASNPAAEGPLALVLEAGKRLGDFDGDGASAFFSDGDCAPFDGSIGPFAMEIPDNGLDDNCVGGDAKGRKTQEELNWGPLPEDFPARPDLVLITVDALRADRTGFLGYGRPTTPNLDRLASRGVIFERAYSQGTGTISSMPSVLSGRYPYELQYDAQGSPPRISDENRMLAELLNEEGGYQTAAISTIIYTRQNRWNLLQGFRTTDTELTSPDPAYRVTSPEVLEKAVAALEAMDGGAPGFLWVHFYDTHSAYMKHPEVTDYGDSLEDLYDGEVAYTDRHLGQLLDLLFERSKTRPTVVILTADHGEGFPSDRGRKTHAYGLFGELLQVPLVLWAPGLKPVRVDSPVGNIDIAPTLLHAAGVPEAGLPGRSLLDYALGQRDDQRYIFSEKTFGAGKGGGGRIHKSATGKRWKYIYQFTEGRDLLFDLEADPKEKRELSSKQRQVTSKLRHMMLDFMEGTSMALYEQRVSPFVLESVPKGLLPCPASFGGGALECAGLQKAVVKVGPQKKALRVDLYLRPIEKLPRDYKLQLVWRDAKGKVLVKKPVWPLGGLLPSSRWQPGKVLLERLDLPLKAGARPDQGSLWLALKTGDGKLLGPDGSKPAVWRQHALLLDLGGAKP